MKILIVTPGFPPTRLGGVEIYSYNLAKEFSLRHQVVVFYPVQQPNLGAYSLKEKEQKEFKFNTVSINKPKNFRKFLDMRLLYQDDLIDFKFKRLLDRIRPDLIHFHHVYGLSAQLIPLSKRKGIPVVLTLHDFWFLCHQVQLLRGNGTLCPGPHPISLMCSDCYLQSTMASLTNLFKPIEAFINNRLIYFSLKQALRFIHGNEIFLQKRNEHLLDILKGTDLLISPSHFLKNKYVQYGVPKEKIIYSPIGIDTKAFHQFQKKENPSAVRFGFLGNVVFPKGVHVLIEAFNKIERKDAELKIYGSYNPQSLYLRHLRRMLRNSRVQFKGKFEDVKRPFSEIDLLIMPSIWYENCPQIIQEAFMTKTPVIASNIGGMAEFVEDKINGLLFEVGNAEDLYKKVIFIMENRGVIYSLRQNIKPVKSIETDARELEALYQSLIGGRI